MNTYKLTAPAASLYPYYIDKKKIDVFIVVTDEEENGTHLGQWRSSNNGFMFAELFKKYLEEINPMTKLVFISFTNTGIKGQMENEINKVIPFYSENMLIFKFDTHRPDLTKLDKIIAQISSLLGCNLNKNKKYDDFEEFELYL